MIYIFSGTSFICIFIIIIYFMCVNVCICTWIFSFCICVFVYFKTLLFINIFIYLLKKYLFNANEKVSCCYKIGWDRYEKSDSIRSLDSKADQITYPIIDRIGIEIGIGYNLSRSTLIESVLAKKHLEGLFNDPIVIYI